LESKTIIRQSQGFSKSIFKNVENTLFIAYGADESARIYNRASYVLRKELLALNDRGNKAVSKHLRSFILPGFALYKGLVECGIENNEAFAFVSNELNKSASREGELMSKFQNLPFAFTLLRFLVKPLIKIGFPKNGWTVVWKEISGKRIAFDMTSCLYYEELKKRDASELCQAFCETDVVSYGPLAPGIIFKRKGTLAHQGIEACDFSFEKGVK